MIKASRMAQAGKTVISLSGTVDDGTALEQEIGPVSGEVVFVCRDVSRINSAGVRSWINYFRKLGSSGVKSTLRECSPTIVESLNIDSDFSHRSRVESILLPYICESCSTEQLVTRTTADIRDANFEAPPIKCDKCGSNAEFDDLPEAYFEFLRAEERA